jgi:uncharacterized Zn finger protein
MSWYYFKPYVSVAQRRAKAAREVSKMQKKGRTITPVHIEGRVIARTFWGKAWCDNLESYSDYVNRLPRGRTYVRNGSVVDLQIQPGRVSALVSGSELYRIDIKIKPLAPKVWKEIKAQCAGKIASMIELLQGRLSQGVMEIITRHEGGMFPSPSQISLDCSCPDWADMCKHVAAALYGVGARLDEKPELFFTLRQVDHLELIEGAGDIRAITRTTGSGKKTIAADELADVFGVELDGANVAPTASAPADLQAVPAAPAKPANGEAVVDAVSAPRVKRKRTADDRSAAMTPPTAEVRRPAGSRRKAGRSPASAEAVPVGSPV